MVSILSCENYDYENMLKVVKETFDNLGGIEKYIKKGEKVLLKVNLVMKQAPEEAATTHPALAYALAKTLVDYGAEVTIGDSPGGPFSETLLKGMYKHTGMEEAAALSGAKLNFDTTSSLVDNPNGQTLKKLTVANMVLNADKVISVCKLKTHSMTRYTGASKNMFGTIPGTTKAEYHFNCQDVESFSVCLTDICLFANPVLSFMDAVEAMEGNGPTAGTPRHVGAVLAGTNPFELDICGAKIINTSPDEIPLLKHATQRGLCKKYVDEIEIIGEKIDKFVVEDFKVPQNKSMYFLGKNPPEFLMNFVKKHINPRPVFDHNVCVGCGDCAANCPAKVIKMENRKPHLISTEKCIRCFCCQELCPRKAVSVYKPFILRMLSKF